LDIHGWEPDGLIVFDMVGPKGEQVAVVPASANAHADDRGEADITLPYEMRGLYPGAWNGFVRMGSQSMRISIDIPESQSSAHPSQ
jgi:hypothetical protein